MLYFIKKIHERNEGHSPSYFYKKHCECKIKNLSAPVNAYVYSIKTNENNFYETKNKEPKNMCVIR